MQRKIEQMLMIYVHDECCIGQMNIKLLFLNKENETLSTQVGDIICFEVPKRGVLQLEGVPQLGGIRYYSLD